ncbi:MAG TPA: VOC family protein [Chloroflexota bacterium]|jgi:catechol-2,3-dioxygenase
MAQLRGVCHVGIGAKDPAALAAFYRVVMGMTVTGGSEAGSDFGACAFLSSRPGEENHEIVFFADRRYAHTAFRVDSLGELRARYRAVVDRGIAIKHVVNHGCSLAFYFDDPEGNMIEVYWATNVDNWQPYGDPVDLAASEAELLADVERVARETGAGRAAGAPRA